MRSEALARLFRRAGSLLALAVVALSLMAAGLPPRAAVAAAAPCPPGIEAAGHCDHGSASAIDHAACHCPAMTGGILAEAPLVGAIAHMAGPRVLSSAERANPLAEPAPPVQPPRA